MFLAQTLAILMVNKMTTKGVYILISQQYFTLTCAQANTRSLQLCKSSFNKMFHHFETVQNEENIWKKPHIHIGKSKVQKLFCLHRFACGKGLEYSDKLFLVSHSDPRIRICN